MLDGYIIKLRLIVELGLEHLYLACIKARGRYFRNFWVGICHWDPGTLSLYHS